MSKFVIMRVTDDQAKNYEAEDCTLETTSFVDLVNFVKNESLHDVCVFDYLGLNQGVSLAEKKMLLGGEQNAAWC